MCGVFSDKLTAGVPVSVQSEIEQSENGWTYRTFHNVLRDYKHL